MVAIPPRREKNRCAGCCGQRPPSDAHWMDQASNQRPRCPSPFAARAGAETETTSTLQPRSCSPAQPRGCPIDTAGQPVRGCAPLILLSSAFIHTPSAECQHLQPTVCNPTLPLTTDTLHSPRHSTGGGQSGVHVVSGWASLRSSLFALRCDCPRRACLSVCGSRAEPSASRGSSGPDLLCSGLSPIDPSQRPSRKPLRTAVPAAARACGACVPARPQHDSTRPRKDLPASTRSTRRLRRSKPPNPRADGGAVHTYVLSLHTYVRTRESMRKTGPPHSKRMDTRCTLVTPLTPPFHPFLPRSPQAHLVPFHPSAPRCQTR